MPARIPLDVRISRRWEWWAARLPRHQLDDLKRQHALYYGRCIRDGFKPSQIEAFLIDDPRMGEPGQLALMEQFRRD